MLLYTGSACPTRRALGCEIKPAKSLDTVTTPGEDVPSFLDRQHKIWVA